MTDKMLYKQLENNIVDAFKPPEHAIANTFHIDGYSFKEMTEILNKCESLSQIYKNRIQNAYQDINTWPDREYGLWHNEQLQALKMRKKFKHE